MTIVLDTNILVSALLTRGGNCHDILMECQAGQLTAWASRAIVDEYEKVLRRPHLAFSETDVIDLLGLFGFLATPHSQESLGLPDPADEKFLAAAILAKADYLVTGNLKHFPPSLGRGVAVVPPAEFLKRWKR